ncbi:MAG: DNA methyltransferase [Thermodesulfobacteriota bacterium]
MGESKMEMDGEKGKNSTKRQGEVLVGAEGTGEGMDKERAARTTESEALQLESKTAEVRRFSRLAATPDAASAKWSNMLILGDNFKALKSLVIEKKKGRVKNADGSEGVRLIYIDPPFASGQNYRGEDGRRAYGDCCKGDDFLEFMRLRLSLLRELLSDDGSIYLHLDWRMTHYIKVLMDEVFGGENFLNEIIWSYGGRGAKSVARQFSRNHDTILLYRKKRHIFNPVIKEKKVPVGGNGFRRDDEGRWFKTAPRGDYTDRSIERLEREGRIYRTRTGSVRIKYFLREEDGFLIEEQRVGDVWDDIPDAMHLPAGERTGYPTQKPETLLRRIVLASSGPGDIVLDAFAGSGTTLAAAAMTGRRWIGLDSSPLAIETMEKRLNQDPSHGFGGDADLLDGLKDPPPPYTLYDVD